jgi:Carboxypeptidase regulatory-like domain
MRRRLTTAFGVTLLCATGVYGQALGKIVGTVTDPAGAVVPGAKITVVNEGTKFTRVTSTNNSGQYVADSFPTGSVSVIAEQTGFERLIRTGIDLTALDTITIDLQLQVGSTQQTVQVSAEASMVQSQNATISTLISNQQTLEMPMNERSFTNLLQLSAGASPTTPGMAASLTGYGMRANNSVSLNGATANNNGFLIDGLFDRQVWVNGIVMNPPIDAIQETRIMGTDYSAEYGNAAGAVTVVLTKSGTNEIHGTAYEYLRNNAFDSNTFFNNSAGRPTAAYRRNEFGGTVGGPIIKNKTFFFGDYQGIRITQPTTTTDTIPSLAAQQMVETGNFANLGTTIYNPYQTTTGANGVTQRVPFAGNIIPAQMLDPAAVKIMELMPTPSSAANTNNYTFDPEGTQQDNQFDVRGDQNLGAGDRVFVKYSYDRTTGLAAGTLPVGQNPDKIDIGEYLTGGGPSYQRNWSITAGYTKLLGPTMVNEANVGVLRNWLEIYNDDTSHNTATSLGIPNINISNLNGGIPYLPISGYTAIGNSNSFPEFTRAVDFPLQDIITKTKGNHTFKVGGGYTRHRFDGHTSVAPRGQYSFGGAFTSQIGLTTSATALGDYALGASAGIERSEQFGSFGLRMWDASVFAEDAWRMTPRLTVTYGVRWELQAPPYEVHNRYANLNLFNPAGPTFAVAGTPSQDANGNCGRALICLDKTAFAPRLGLAYLLTKDGKTVFRSGYGESYFEANNGGRMLHSNPPMNIIQQYTFPTNLAPGILLSQGIPLPVQPNLSDPTQLTGLYSDFDPHMKLNASLQITASIQREIASNLFLDVAYVRTLTEDMTNAIVGNQAVPGPGAFNPRRPFYAENPVLGDVDFRTNYGMAKYNAMQVKATKRYSFGLSANLAWTWSHNMSDTMGANSSTRPQNSLCYSCEFGDLPEDRRHMVVLNYVYELPFGTGRRYVSKGWASYVVGDWDISNIWTMYTGMHFGPSLGTSVSNALAVSSIAPTERPNLSGNPNLPTDQRTITHWFDVAAFSIPAEYTFGDAGTGILVGPGYFDTDLAIHRNFPIKERYKLTFRAEAFNTFNHANFTNPNATIGTTSAGFVSGTYTARQMQMALRLMF